MLNYGFIVEENDGNEYPINIKVDNLFPKFKEKVGFFHEENELKRSFRIQENLLEQQVVDLFSFLRFILFDGDLNILWKVDKIWVKF